MILDICGIDRSEPSTQPALIKWSGRCSRGTMKNVNSAHLNGTGVHKADTSVTNQSVECDPREVSGLLWPIWKLFQPSTSDGLSYEGLVQQLHQDEEERQCQVGNPINLCCQNEMGTPSTLTRSFLAAWSTAVQPRGSSCYPSSGDLFPGLTDS